MKNIIPFLISAVKGALLVFKGIHFKDMFKEIKESADGLFGKGEDDPVKKVFYLVTLIGLVLALIVAYFDIDLGKAIFDMFKDIDAAPVPE